MGPLFQSTLRRTEASPLLDSFEICRDASFINEAKVKFSFCSGTGKVLLSYWLRANPNGVGAGGKVGVGTAVCWDRSRHTFMSNAQLRFFYRRLDYSFRTSFSLFSFFE